MKKLLLTFSVCLLSFAAAKAQSLSYAEDILNQLGYPYSVVSAFDPGSSTAGTIAPDSSGVKEGIGFENEGSNNIPVITGAAWTHPNNGQTYPSAYWTQVGAYPDYGQGAISQQSYGTVFLKFKGTGALKPLQLKSDGTRMLIFGSDGYSYRFTIGYTIVNGTVTLTFTPGGN